MAREGTETRLIPVHWAKRDRCMHGALIDGDGYGTMRGMFAICEPLYRTESFLPYLTAISLCYQHVQSSLKL